MRSTDLSWDEQTRADAGRLWAGGVVTALVAAGVALVGVMVLHDVLDAALLVPGGRMGPGDDAMTVLPLWSGVVALLATGLLHLLMTTTPRAPHFFGLIATLVMAVTVLQVFVTDAKLITELQSTVFYLVVGITITSSLYGVGHTAVRYHRRQGYQESHPDEGYHRGDPQPYRSRPQPYGDDPRAYGNPQPYRNEPEPYRTDPRHYR